MTARLDGPEHIRQHRGRERLPLARIEHRGGVQTVTSMSAIAAPTMNERATLLASPTHVTRAGAAPVWCSRIVMRSASVWQGCASSVSPLITGTSAAAAIVSSRGR